jgi:hypothetical protein
MEKEISINSDSPVDTTDSSIDKDHEVPVTEPDPDSFLMTVLGKSTKEGVLVTHSSFKFTKNNWSRDGTTYWYRCSSKKATGCTATATITL